MRAVGRGREAFDVVFYSPWVAPLLGAVGGPPPGGAETQMLLVARLLAASGYRVCIITTHVGMAPPATVDGIRVVSRPTPDIAPSRIPLVRLLRVARDRWRRFAAVRATTFVRRSGGSEAAAVWLMARLRRSRFVYSSASVVDFDLARIEPDPRRVRLLDFAIRHADEVVVQTPEQVELCRERFGRDPILIRSVAEPVNAPRAAPEAFLWVGRLSAYKRPLAYLDLAQAVPERRFRMVIMEGGDADPRLVREVRRRAAEIDNLELLPAMPRPELLELVAGAVAVVSTSEFEGMPNVFLEGWARGVPALALSYDPDGVIRQHGVGHFADGSAERLRDLARQLWEERRDERMDVRCRSYIERHHAPAVVARQWAEALALGVARGGR